VSEGPIPPAGKSVWKPFPSTRIPQGFTEDRVKEYFQLLPQVSFSYTAGVLAALESEGSTTTATTNSRESVRATVRTIVDSDAESGSDPDDPTEVNEDVNTTESTRNYFFELVKRAVLNCLPRGKRYVKSGHVLTVLDCVREGYYFLKGEVHASMEEAVRSVTVTVLTATGDICTASCTCKARSLKRCAHIASVMHLVLQHIEISGNEGEYSSYPCRVSTEL